MFSTAWSGVNGYHSTTEQAKCSLEIQQQDVYLETAWRADGYCVVLKIHAIDKREGGQGGMDNGGIGARCGSGDRRGGLYHHEKMN